MRHLGEKHCPFQWTEQRLVQLRSAYMTYATASLTQTAERIAEKLAWPEISVHTKLTQLYAPATPFAACALPQPLPASRLATLPEASVGPFLWQVQVAGIGLVRWSLRYRYSDWPYLRGQVVAYQNRAYRVLRVGCASLEVAAVAEPACEESEARR